MLMTITEVLPSQKIERTLQREFLSLECAKQLAHGMQCYSDSKMIIEHGGRVVACRELAKWSVVQ